MHERIYVKKVTDDYRVKNKLFLIKLDALGSNSYLNGRSGR